MIRLYDTMARRKRDFVPADPKRITMYVCGPTVYGRAHIGNARPAVVFDTLARLIRHEFGPDSLTYARNVTDIDDKIIAAAEDANSTPAKISERYERLYLEDMGALGVLPPDIAPHATAEIPTMVAMIDDLIKRRHAYHVPGHEVLFDIASLDEYPTLTPQSLDQMQSGDRAEDLPYKRNKFDFVLWKPARGNEIAWDSPWGRGRPGWHIECSAMIQAHLGETIDIHGGGLDLIFPHHENEIAQSRCAHGGAKLAEYWMHNGFVDFGSEKMSKSLGNVVTPEELLRAGHRGSHLRHALLSGHYRQPLNWTDKLIGQSQRTVDRWRTKWDRRVLGSRIVVPSEKAPPHPSVLEALQEDLNTPEALAALGKLFDEGDWASVEASAGLLGIDFTQRPADFAVELWAKIDARVADRNAAKKARDFATADRIRDELKAEGIILEDGPDGTTWRRA